MGNGAEKEAPVGPRLMAGDEEMGGEDHSPWATWCCWAGTSRATKWALHPATSGHTWNGIGVLGWDSSYQ